MFTLPEDFIERLKIIAPGVDPETAFKTKDVVSFRINTLKTTRDALINGLKQLGIDVSFWEQWDHVILVKASDASIVKSSTFVSSGELYPQGLQSTIPVIVLDPQPGENILDLCAAPGSKSSQIAAYLQGTGQLTANEAVKDRFYKLKAVMALLGASANLTLLDGRRYQARDALFDRILVDAPCSSEGRFYWGDKKSCGYWSVRKIHEMAHKQKGLLLNAERLLKPGGVLVYSTCTFAPEENEAVVDWLLRKTEGRLTLEPINLQHVPRYPSVSQWNDKEFSHDVSGCLRVFPDAKYEGFFIAKFIKSDYK